MLFNQVSLRFIQGSLGRVVLADHVLLGIIVDSNIIDAPAILFVDDIH